MVRVSRCSVLFGTTGIAAFAGLARTVIAWFAAVMLVEVIRCIWWWPEHIRYSWARLPSGDVLLFVLWAIIEITVRMYELIAILLLMGSLTVTTYKPWGRMVRVTDGFLEVFTIKQETLVPVLMFAISAINPMPFAWVDQIAMMSLDHFDHVGDFLGFARWVLIILSVPMWFYYCLGNHLYRSEGVIERTERKAWAVDTDLPQRLETVDTWQYVQVFALLPGPCLAFILQGMDMFQSNTAVYIQPSRTQFVLTFFVIARVGVKSLSYYFADKPWVAIFGRHKMWQAFMPSPNEPVLVIEAAAAAYVTLVSVSEAEFQYSELARASLLFVIIVAIVLVMPMFVLGKINSYKNLWFYGDFVRRNVRQKKKWFRFWFSAAITCGITATVMGYEAMVINFYSVKITGGEGVTGQRDLLAETMAYTNWFDEQLKPWVEKVDPCSNRADITAADFNEPVTFVSIVQRLKMCAYEKADTSMDVALWDAWSKCDSEPDGDRWLFEASGGGQFNKHIKLVKKDGSSMYLNTDSGNGGQDGTLVMEANARRRFAIVEHQTLPGNFVVQSDQGDFLLVSSSTGYELKVGTFSAATWARDVLSVRVAVLGPPRAVDVLEQINETTLGQPLLTRWEAVKNGAAEVDAINCFNTNQYREQNGDLDPNWLGGACKKTIGDPSVQVLDERCAQEFCNSWYRRKPGNNPNLTEGFLPKPTYFGRESEWNNFHYMVEEDWEDERQCNDIMCFNSFALGVDGQARSSLEDLHRYGVEEIRAQDRTRSVHLFAQKGTKVVRTMKQVNDVWLTLKENLDRLVELDQYMTADASWLRGTLSVWVTGFVAIILGFWQRMGLPGGGGSVVLSLLCILLVICNFVMIFMVDFCFSIAQTMIERALPTMIVGLNIEPASGVWAVKGSFILATVTSLFFFWALWPRQGIWRAEGDDGYGDDGTGSNVVGGLLSHTRTGNNNSILFGGQGVAALRTGAADGPQPKKEVDAKWTIGNWMLSVVFMLPVTLLAFNRMDCKPHYRRVGQGYCMGDFGQIINVTLEHASQPRFNSRHDECERLCTEASNPTDSSLYCIGYVSHWQRNTSQAGESTCGIIMASQALQLRRSTGSDQDYRCWAKEEQNHECHAIVWEGSLSPTALEYIAQSGSVRQVLDATSEATEALEEMTCSPSTTLARDSVLQSIADSDTLEQMVVKLKAFLVAVRDTMKKLAIFIPEDGSDLHAGIPKFRILPFDAVKLIPDQEYWIYEWIFLFGPSVAVAAICVTGFIASLFIEVSEKAEVAASKFMDILAGMALPLALVGLELVAAVTIFHEIFDNMDLGFFQVKFYTTKNVTYATICNMVASFVSVAMLINKWIPIGKASEEEQKEQEEQKGYVVHNSDANFKARIELKREEAHEPPMVAPAASSRGAPQVSAQQSSRPSVHSQSSRPSFSASQAVGGPFALPKPSGKPALDEGAAAPLAMELSDSWSIGKGASRPATRSTQKFLEGLPGLDPLDSDRIVMGRVETRPSFRDGDSHKSAPPGDWWTASPT